MVQETDTLQQEEEKDVATTSSVVVKKTCPKCGKSFKPSGLPGHLRFVHSLKDETVSKIAKIASPDNVSKIDKIFQAYERINKVRERMEFVKAHRTDKERLFSTDEASDEAMEALKEEESRLTDELRLLQGKRKVRDWFGAEGWINDKKKEGHRS